MKNKSLLTYTLYSVNWFTVLFFLTCVVNAAAQGLHFKTVNMSDGLPDNVVKCFVQDTKGYLWMGTFNGLCRYDGMHFITFHSCETDTTSVVDNHVEALLLDGDDLLVGTSSGLDRMSICSGRFSRCRYVGQDDSVKVLDRYIFRLLKVGDMVYALSSTGRMWMKCRGEKLFREVSDFAPQRVLGIERWREGFLFLLTSEELLLVDAASLKVKSRLKVEGLPMTWNNLYYSANMDVLVLGSGIGYPSRAFAVDGGRRLRYADVQLPPNLKAATDYGQSICFATDGQGLVVCGLWK